MKALALFLVLVVSAVTVVPAAADLPYRPRRLSEYVLTPAEYDELTLNQKISYVKFLIVFVSTVEGMQVPPTEKHALRDAIERYLAMVETRAYADGTQTAGGACFAALSVGQWSNSGGQWACTPATAAAGPSCASGQVKCGAGFSTLINELNGGVCMQAAPGTNIGQQCANKIAGMFGVGLDQKISAKVMAATPGSDQRYQMEALSGEMQAALKNFENQRMPGGQTLADYCANGNAKTGGLQREDCAALVKLANVFDANVVIGADTWKPGSLTPKIAKVDDKKLRAARAAAAAATPAPAPAPAPADLRAKPAQPKPQASAKPPTVAPPLEETAPVPRPALVRSHADPKPAAAKPAPMNDKKLGVLACVAKGMRIPGGPTGGLSHWLSLLGIMAQNTYGPYNVNDPVSLANFRLRVMEMVTSYGYCTDTEYPMRGGASADTIAAWMNGERPLKLGCSSGSAEENSFAKAFGLQSRAAPGMCYATELFNPRTDDSGFASPNLPDKQWHFRSLLNARLATDKTSPFSRCAAKVEHRLHHDPYFNMCEPTCANGARVMFSYNNDYRVCERTIRPTEASPREWANNTALYDSMAKACGLPPRPPQDHRCHTRCVKSVIFPTQATNMHGECLDNSDAPPMCLTNCPGQHDGGEPSSPRGGGEPSTDRGTYSAPTPTPTPTPTPGPDPAHESEPSTQR